MSQAHVTDFFSTRKRTNGGNPSKRRKLGSSNESINAFSIQESNTIPGNNIRNSKNVTDSRPENAVIQTPPTGKCSSHNRNKSKKKGTQKSKSQSGQPLLKDILSNDCSASDKDDYRQAMMEGDRMEEVTSAWDEHDGVQLTPSKRTKDPHDSDSEISQGSRKRTRCGSKKIEIEEAAMKDTGVKIMESKARKQLMLKQVEKIDNIPEENTAMTKPETPSSFSNESKKMSDIPCPMSPRLKKTIEKVKQLTSTEKKVTADKIKEKLQKCNRLEEIKAKLSEMSKNMAELKKSTTVAPKLDKFDSVVIDKPTPTPTKPVVMSPVKQEAPAYERFHSLATPAPPTLSLPYRYKLLAEMFRNCDTVVSMLHNRAEICTFSKLKAAVQDMSKRNFEEKNLGQIKTVHSEAYTLRQEKGFAGFGKKTSGYQLTVEANLNQDSEKAAESYKTKQTFTAKHLLERRNVFSSKLISIVKRYHKEFLSNLDRPLNVPDDKITRWHPKFRLDEVPDIEPAEVPTPPNVQVYQTAKDVLENARGKVLPNVEKALESVSTTHQEPVTPVEPSPAQTNQLKGIPQSLLEKIRAKEAAKMEAVMTRDPKEDKRQKMLQRLPEMMRILRAHFVTEKKPALLKREIIQKLTDSCRSSIAVGDVESHVNMMIQILPQWLKQVEIRKGKYIKMDRNIELQTLITKVNNSIKS